MRRFQLRLATGASILASVFALTACGGDDASGGGAGTGGASGAAGAAGSGGSAGGDPNACVTPGATRCAEGGVQTCNPGAGQPKWSAAVECPGEQNCRQDRCQDPTAEQQQQAGAVDKYVTLLSDHSAWPLAVDTATVRTDATRRVLKGDGSDSVFFESLRYVQLSWPQGHQSLFAASQAQCQTADLYWQNSSRFGVCGRPHGDDIVVTFARAGNPLGLEAGDLITAENGVSGDALFDLVQSRPTCGAVYPATSGKRASAAASYFGSVPAGAKLSVTPVSGATPYSLDVPEQFDSQPTRCADALGRDVQFNIRAETRSDGVAVIRLPRFFPLGKSPPTNPADAQKFIDDFIAELATEFDKVKSAPMLIWDIRGNGGGITPAGLAIAGGMPTAKATDVSYCVNRISGTNPPSFGAQKYAIYAVTPGGPFAYTGKVAVVVDGLAYSAADYFPLAVSKATATPLVGSASAGAYGGAGSTPSLGGVPEMLANADANNCKDAATDASLEGTAVAPDLAVEYEPQDLAKGVDTLLEAAATLLKQ